MKLLSTMPKLLFGAALLLGLHACDGGGTTTPPPEAPAPIPAATVQLAASPTAITVGTSTTLTWTTTNATACTTSGGWSGNRATSGSEAQTPAATGSVTYTLTCTGSGGSGNASASVTVSAPPPPPPPPTVTLAANPASVVLGSASTLTWSSTNATACTASGAWSGSRTISGSEAQTPAAVGSITYTLTCTGSGGSGNASASVTVSAPPPPPPPTVTLTVNPASVVLGSASTLTWSSTNATACTASGAWTGSRATAGSASQIPAAAGPAVYTLTCTGAGGSSAASATVTANAPPTVTITASPTGIVLGDSSTLTWSSTNATACTASGAWSSSRATSGSESQTPAAIGQATYTLTCTGPGGSANAAASVSVTAPPLPTVTLAANPTSVVQGSATTLTWSSTNATGCTASGAWTGSRAISGSAAQTPAAVGTAAYTLTCTGPGGSVAATANVTVTPLPTVSLTFNGRAVDGGNTFTGQTNDGGIDNAAITINVGSRSFTGVADGNGNFSIPVAVPVAETGGFVTIGARGGATQTTTRLVSLLGTFSTLRTTAGADNTLTSSELFRINVTNVSTAEAVLVAEATSSVLPVTSANTRSAQTNSNAFPVDDATLATAITAIDPQQSIDIAVAIALVIDRGVALPAGVADTLALASSPSARNALLAAQQQGPNNTIYLATLEDLLNDRAVVMGATAATVPSTVYYDQAVTTPNDDLYGSRNRNAERYDFNADGTGRYSAIRLTSTNMRWTVDATGNIVATFNPAFVVSTSTINNNGTIINCSTEIQSITLLMISPTSATNRPAFFRTCSDPTFNSLVNDTVTTGLFATAAQLASMGTISTAEVSGRTLALKLYDTALFGGRSTQPDPADLVTFNANGGGSTRLFNLSLTWTLTNGALVVNYANGVVATYRRVRGLFDNASLWLSEYSTPTGLFTNNSIVATVDGSLLFLGSEVPGDYYQYGIGASTDDYLNAVVFSETGDVAGDIGILKGFAIRFSNTGNSSSLIENFFVASNGSIGRETSVGGGRVWGIRSDGTLTQQAISNVNGLPPCSVEFDTASGNCRYTDIRDIFPISSRSNRRIWLERRYLTQPISPSMPNRPADYVVRFYDLTPVGDFDLPRATATQTQASARPPANTGSRETAAEKAARVSRAETDVAAGKLNRAGRPGIPR